MKLRYIKRLKKIRTVSNCLEYCRGEATGKHREVLAEARGRMLLGIRSRWILLLLLCLYSLYAGIMLLCSRGVGAFAGTVAASLAGCLLAAGTLNLFYHRLYRELSHLPWAGHLQILLDVLFATAIIHYSGGIFSPFWPVYPIVALEASLLLERKRDVLAMCCAAGIAYGALVAAEYSGTIAPVALPLTGWATGSDPLYCLLMWSWISALTVVLGGVGLTVAGVARRREGALKQMVVKDQMTNLYNRNYFFKELNSEIQRSKRYNHVFSVIFLDIDDFKTFNDTFGHLEGDRLLRELARILRSKARRSETAPPYDIDVPCRYGGEEFAVILPETPLMTSAGCPSASDGMNALAFAERIRQEVQHLSSGGAGITVSIGAASFPRHGLTAEDLVKAADEALYRSKKEGKNRIVIAETVGKPQNGISSSGLNVGSSYPGDAPNPGSSGALPPP